MAGPAAVALSPMLQLGALWLPPLRDLLGTEPLTVPEPAISAVAATLPGLVTCTAAQHLPE